MKRYSGWKPTQFDSAGLACTDKQDWFVAPCGRNRDSGDLEESNWAAQCSVLDVVDSEGADHEIHSFNHWACGWFDIMLIRPDTVAFKLADELEDQLADYPILNEDDYSRRECESAEEGWRNASLKERMQACRDAHISVFAARRDYIPSDDNGSIQERFR
jgi:hypothetical protein